jgi:hypothetical protein
MRTRLLVAMLITAVVITYLAFWAARVHHTVASGGYRGRHRVARGSVSSLDERLILLSAQQAEIAALIEAGRAVHLQQTTAPMTPPMRPVAYQKLVSAA